MAYPYPIPEVIGIEIYNQDVVVLRGPGNGHRVDWTRSDITQFSKASRQRLAFIACNTDVRFTSMLTLTYPKAFPNDGAQVKRNLKAFRESLRRYYDGIEYLWFLEFQRRGAPHIHFMLAGMRVWETSQRWMSETWYRICATGDPKHLLAGTRLERIRLPDGAAHYVNKECAKMYQKAVPPGYRNVGRFWGHTRNVAPQPKVTLRCTNDDLAGALQETGWIWQRGDEIRYHTLYGAASHLHEWMDGGILELSSSTGASSVPSIDKKGDT